MAQIPVAQTQSAPTRVRWRIFSVLFLLVAVNLMDRITISIGMPTIKDEFGLSPAMQGLILSSFFWSYTLLQIPGGWALDRFGPRKVLTSSTILWGISQIGLALATGGLSLIIARIALGVAETPVSPSGAKMSANWLARTERGRGAALMDCGSPLGVAVGGLIIAWLIATLDSWRLAFALAGVFSMSLAVVAWTLLRDKPQQHKGVNQAELALIEAGKVQVAGESVAPPPVKGMGIDTPSMLGLMFGRGTWAMIYFGLLTWGPGYLAQARGFDLKAIGSATFIIFLFGALGSLCLGYLADTLSRKGLGQGRVIKSIITLSGIIILGIFYVLPDVSNPVTAVTLLTIASFFLAGSGSVYWSLPALLAHPSRAGLVGGTMNMAGSAGGILVPILVGLILQWTNSFTNVLIFFSVCSALFVIGTWFVRFNKPHADMPLGQTQN